MGVKEQDPITGTLRAWGLAVRYQVQWQQRAVASPLSQPAAFVGERRHTGGRVARGQSSHPHPRTREVHRARALSLPLRTVVEGEQPAAATPGESPGPHVCAG